MSIETFQKLHQGRTDAYGVYDPAAEAGKEYLTIKKNLTPKQYQDHLAGLISLGVIPITPDGKCSYGIIDDDYHHKNGKYDYNNLRQKIKLLRIPVNVYKSKSGGAHMAVYLDQPYPAKDVRHILKKFAYQLCEGSYDLFPKQEELKKGEWGNYANLPYHHGNTRVLIDSEGKELNFEEAMLYASKRVVKLDKLGVFKILADQNYTDSRNCRLFRARQYFKKHFGDDFDKKVRELNNLYQDPLPEQELNATVLRPDAPDYSNPDINEDTPTELITYDISVYRKLGIKKPNFILERLIKEKSINWLFGPKGNMKTEFGLGIANALTRGKPLLDYECLIPYPVFWGDFEMGGYDLIERDDAYLLKYGTPPPENYFHILHWEQQKDQNIPDIAGELGQNLILKGLEHQKKLVGKPPLFILDNLRSASGYKENDADAWRPIGKWLLKLRGLGFPTLVLDHTGYDESHMRGTSSKSDWANVCLGIKARTAKGSKVAVVDLHFDKARGLRPDETAPFAAQYDFKGNWTLASSQKDERNEKLVAEIKVWKAKEPDITQETLADVLNISTGKVSQLMKKIKKQERPPFAK
jgi:hypothetical protein